MKVAKVIIVSLVALVALVTAVLFLIGYFKQKPGGISVNSDPVSDVYINGVLMGKTPYKGTREAGEVNLKMVPASPDLGLLAYETKITLVPGVETIVGREFGKTEDVSSGDIISFDRIGGGDTGLIVISLPENAQVSIDGLPQGFAPYKTSDISPAQHQITVRAPGYTDRVMTVKTQAGFRLSLFAKLAKTLTQEPTSTPVAVAKTYVQVLSTPTGFLRVRSGPGTTGSEIAQIKPGSQYLFLDEDAATGWVKIQYEAPATGLPNGIEGWVSGQYVKKITVMEEATASANIK